MRSPATDDADAFNFRILIGREKTIGRVRGVDFVIDAPLVSRVHCRLTAHSAGRLEVQDLKNRNLQLQGRLELLVRREKTLESMVVFRDDALKAASPTQEPGGEGEPSRK